MKRLSLIWLFAMILGAAFNAAADDNSVRGGMTIRVTDVETITKPKKPKKPKKPLTPITPGWQHNINLTGNYYDFDGFPRSPNVGLEYIFGYRFNNLLYVGLGTGYYHALNEEFGPDINIDDFKNDADMVGDINLPYIPIFIHGKLYLSSKRCQPFFALSAGANISVYKGDLRLEFTYPYYWYHYSFDPSNLFIEPAFGLSVRTSSKFALNFQIAANIYGSSGVKLQDASHFQLVSMTACSLAVKIGCTF